MGKNPDPGSGINIPDPQHWLSLFCYTVEPEHSRFLHSRIWLSLLSSMAEPGIRGGATLLDIIFHGSVTQLNMAFLFCCTVEPGFHHSDTRRNLGFIAITRLKLAFITLLDGWTWLSCFCYTAGPAFHGSVIRLNLAFTALLHG
jgi:hypothetical protein